MSIKNILVTNDDGSTQNFVPEVSVPVTPARTITIPLGVDVVLVAEGSPTV